MIRFAKVCKDLKSFEQFLKRFDDKAGKAVTRTDGSADGRTSGRRDQRAAGGRVIPTGRAGDKMTASGGRHTGRAADGLAAVAGSWTGKLWPAQGPKRRAEGARTAGRAARWTCGRTGKLGTGELGTVTGRRTDGQRMGCRIGRPVECRIGCRNGRRNRRQ